MKTKENLDIEYLYKRLTLAQKIFNEDVEGLEFQDWEQKDEFNEFLQKCTLEDLIFIIVKAFKDKYPNYLEIRFYLTESTYREKNDAVLKIVGEPKYRTDITKIESTFYDPDILFEFHLEKMVIHFKEAMNVPNLKNAITEALARKTFIENNSKIIVEDSAVKELEITANNFTLVVNKEKVVYY